MSEDNTEYNPWTDDYVSPMQTAFEENPTPPNPMLAPSPVQYGGGLQGTEMLTPAIARAAEEARARRLVAAETARWNAMAARYRAEQAAAEGGWWRSIRSALGAWQVESTDGIQYAQPPTGYLGQPLMGGTGMISMLIGPQYSDEYGSENIPQAGTGTSGRRGEIQRETSVQFYRDRQRQLHAASTARDMFRQAAMPTAMSNYSRILEPYPERPQPPEGVPASITSTWGTLARNNPSPNMEKENAEIQAGIAAGLQVYRDKRTGRIQYFDDVTFRMIDPDDLQREYIGGFDTDYAVDQTLGILNKKVTGPDPSQWSKNGYRDSGPGFGTPDIYQNYVDATHSRQREVTAPNYYAGDNWSYFAGASASEKMAVQERLVAAGYVDPNNITPGVWDFQSAKAMEYLMTDANGNGVTWVEMLQEAEASGGRPQSGGGGTVRTINPFVAPEYIRPDYDTMKQAVRGAFGQILGRQLQDYELKVLAESMDADYRAEYEARVLAARREYDRQAAAIRAGATYAAEAGTVQGVDPIASVNERILEKYSDEIERQQEIGERAANVNLVMQAMGMLESTVRRG